MGFTDTAIRTEADQIVVPAEPGDHDRLSHYVDRDDLMRALVDGTPCTALCGKTWTPTRDGLKFPLCPECKEAWEALPSDE